MAVEATAPRRETTPAPERLRTYKPLVGLQARMLYVDRRALQPDALLPQISREALGNFEQRDYGVFEHASTRERQDYWQKRNEQTFDECKRAWIRETVDTFANGKSFFQETAQGQAWTQALSLLHMNATDFSQADAERLYNAYLTGQQKDSQVKRFVGDVLAQYQTTERLRNDLAPIEWLSRIFGENSSAIVTQLTDAEAQLKMQPDVLIEKANREETVNGQQKTRVNNLQPREVELLTFLCGEPAPTEPPTGRQETPPLTEESLKNIIEGRGFAEIERVGWPSYREALTRIPYSQMVEHQIGEAQQLREQARANPQEIQKDELRRLNSEAVQRANKLAGELPTQYTRDKDYPFFCIKTDSGKLSMRGKQYREGNIPHTRLYFTTYTRNAPEAYLSLFEALKDENALDTINLSLNLENFVLTDSELERVTAQDNTIILYMTEFTPETMKKVATAVRKAKEARPEYWQMKPNDLARAREVIMHNFKIPLDDTTGFVEMATDDSYDTTDRLAIGRDFDSNYNYPYIDFAQGFQTLAARLKPYTPDNPGRFVSEAPSMKRRRKYIPGILFEEVASTQSDWEKVKNERFSDIGWQQASRIREIVGPSEVIQKNLPVYYPGAQVDVEYPLAFTDASNFIFTDFVYIHGDGRLREDATPDDAIKRVGGTIKSITNEGILGQGGKRIITFDWSGKERKITMYAEDASTFIPTELQEGASMVLIKAPTPFSREVGSENPGYIISVESLVNIYEHVAPNGFIHWYPTEYLDSEMVGFQKLLDAPESDDPLYRYKNGYPLFQKVQQEPLLPSLLQIEKDVGSAILLRDGVMTGAISDRSLGFFEEELREIRTNYEQLPSEKQRQLNLVFRAVLTPSELTKEQRSRLFEYGKRYGITDEQKALAYLQQANEVALKIFPELKEETT